ncbi:MAG TPA: tetratricopeptide repeat protein [Gemmatimonadota bacterium]|nr:tetratricopeptide repeat protein [Gemmatimonadota bacterium]
MIPRSRTASPTGSPRACSRTSIATAARCTQRRPRADARLLVLALAALYLVPACAYLNTFYNARQAYDEGVRLSAGSDSLSQSAREAFQSAAEKSAIVLERYPDSEYVDDALFLMGDSFFRMGSWADAAASYERYVIRFPEGEHAAAARLGWARSERRLGDTAAAAAALAPILDQPASGVAESEVIYEHALILLATGRREQARQTYDRLLAEHPEFARDRELTVEFADAQLEAGEYDDALAAYRALAAATTEPQYRRTIEIRAARALALEGRGAEALDAYDRVLAGALPDSLAAEVEVERGAILESRGEWDAADEAYVRVAELAPGSPTASRATLHRGRIVWRVRGEREAGLDVLLDAFIHSPASAWGDSARNESRALARLLHYERIAEGEVPVPQIEREGLARSTAMYRLAEEVLEVEQDREAAAELFWQLAERYPDSPWRPFAMLASGKLLADGQESIGTGVARMLSLIESYPDHQAADSARRELGFDVPDRPGDFYASDPTLMVLTRVLPPAGDPMLEIEDQMNRYGARDQSSRSRLRGASRAIEAEREREQGENPEGGQPPPDREGDPQI